MSHPARHPFARRDPEARRDLLSCTLAPAILALAFAACAPSADPAASDFTEFVATDPEARGLRLARRGAAPGYVLFSPLISGTSYLVDAAGQVVHTWDSDFAPLSLYLLDNGNLLRLAHEPKSTAFQAGGEAGRIQELTWDGEVVWDWVLADDERLLHHDIEVLPNGNLLAIAWERRSHEEALARGRLPDLVNDKGLWPEWVLEIEPIPPREARIVWEWHVWDHLVQDQDPQRENYGELAAYPGRVDVNGDRHKPKPTQDEIDQLRALGYISDDVEPEDLRPDFLHINSIDYHARLDQILLSVPAYNEIWVLDHSVSTEEARGSTGGRAGRGGELLYRWGNPMLYGRAAESDRIFGSQHDANWIPEGLPGTGNILVFNNEAGRGEEKFSTVLEIAPPLDGQGGYQLVEGAAYGPDTPAWSYEAADRTSFYSMFISGAQRLPNGNTFVTSGHQGRLFEVTPSSEIVWEYWNPFSGNVREPDGSLPQPLPPGAGYSIFRATKIPAGHPGLVGRDLNPLDPQPEPVLPPEPDPPPVSEE
ncbi:MAG TPA: aryl-sulfate sulfotransferase [Thermoanaerobaculia bacterium]|nr:aryl-sulfate sulfotransferase [Thermoanaerobaculia bacterium]